MSVPEWHERVLSKALKVRESNPDFRFNLRMRDVGDNARLSKGYWFTGNEGYLFFAPFRPNDPTNKTRSIGFVIDFDDSEVPEGCHLEVVYKGIADPVQQKIYQRILSELGTFKQDEPRKFKRHYPQKDPLSAFTAFMSDDYPRICNIIKSEKAEKTFLVTEEDFQAMLSKISEIKASLSTSTPTKPTAVSGEKVVSLAGDGAPQNLILFGPPGTGKTYWMQQKFSIYTDAPNTVDPDTWAIEVVGRYGWRAVIAAALADIKLPAKVPALRDNKWIQVKAKERGRTSPRVNATIWSYLQQHTPKNVETVNVSDRREPFIFTKSDNGKWSLLPGWQDSDADSAELVELLRKGPVASNEEVRRYRLVSFHPSISYEDFIQGIRPVSVGNEGATHFRMVDGPFKEICKDARANPRQRYALFIDEINRANISKVFGELITLIEKDKRIVVDEHGRVVRGLEVQLPGSTGEDTAEPRFGVPANLDIYGTMNTADRSIALLDIALRRRFDFEEKEPLYDVFTHSPEGIDLGKLLRRINDRLEFLLDRDHRIGHAYFIRIATLPALREVFAKQVIPLLQEYFFDDLASVGRVLATASSTRFVTEESLSHHDLFLTSSSGRTPETRNRYRVTPPESWKVDAFQGIYAPVSPPHSEGAPA